MKRKALKEQITIAIFGNNEKYKNEKNNFQTLYADDDVCRTPLCHEVKKRIS